MNFIHIEFLYLLIIPIILWFFIRKNNNTIEHFFSPEILQQLTTSIHSFTPHTRVKILLISMACMIVALARPVIEGEKVQVKQQLSQLIIAVDVSKSMMATDIYPNRFEFARHKIIDSLKNLKNTQVGIIGFANRAFLIAPLTTDFTSLATLMSNASNNLNLAGTDIISAIEVADDLLTDDSVDKNTTQQSKQAKQLLLLTDGGDNKNFDEEIKYAKTHKMELFIYDISTKKGATLQGENGVIKDARGNIVIVAENPYLKELSDNTNGKYLKYSLQNNDIVDFINSFKRLSEAKNLTVDNNKELFYYPLIIALLLVCSAFFSLPKIIQKYD